MKCFVALFVMSLLLFGCASNSLFMDARPSGDGPYRMNIGGSLRGTLTDSAGVKSLKNVDASFLPVDFMLEGGVGDQADVFLKYTIPVTVNFGFKYAFDDMNPRQFHYSALGFSIGTDLKTLFKDSTNKDPALYFDMRVPFYQTIAFSKYLSFSIIPNAIMRVDDRYFQVLAGANANIKVGNFLGLCLEGSYMHNFRYEPEYQFGLNFFFPWRLGR